MSTLFYRLENLTAKYLFMTRRIPTRKKEVFLTFDDGPEKDITQFILSELNKYQFKATFFCRGDHAEDHPDLMQQIRSAGHSVGNHTFHHCNAYQTSVKDYVKDVEKADEILHTGIFRPPFGCIRLPQLFRLKRNYKLIYWSLDSKDHQSNIDCIASCIELLCQSTRPGDIVLFHFSQEHASHTKAILAPYLDYLSRNGFRGVPITH